MREESQRSQASKRVFWVKGAGKRPNGLPWRAIELRRARASSSRFRPQLEALLEMAMSLRYFAFGQWSNFRETI
jgi:hypothetical protein